MVVRPALGLLVSDRVKQLVHDDRELGARVLHTILRFGTADESEARRVIFYLHDFDRELLSDQSLRSQLASAIEETRRRALNVGSSVVCEAIDALLIAPALSERAGLLDALDGLHRVVSSSASKRPSLGLADAYDAVLDLCLYAEAIRSELSDESLWSEWVDKLAEAIARMWGHAQHTPVLLAPFSLPSPTRPHPVIVHNWAFATRRFVEVLGHSEILESALRSASTSTELAPHVMLASATRAIVPGSSSSPTEDIEDARTENREGFYTAVGRWLVRLQQLDTDKGDLLVEVLLNQVLTFGPRAIDSAVFLAAYQRGAHGRASRETFRDYSIRLAAQRDLDLVLRPIVSLVKADA